MKTSKFWSQVSEKSVGSKLKYLLASQRTGRDSTEGDALSLLRRPSPLCTEVPDSSQLGEPPETAPLRHAESAEWPDIMTPSLVDFLERPADDRGYGISFWKSQRRFSMSFLFRVQNNSQKDQKKLAQVFEGNRQAFLPLLQDIPEVVS